MPIHNGTDLHLYYHPCSFYSQKVIMSMYQKKLKFRPVLVDINRGKQFEQKFLSLNPRGEVPVLVDEIRVIPDSEHIIDYLEDNFTNGSPPLRPSDPELRQRADQIHHAIHNLNVDALTWGTALYDDLELNPKPPYDNVNNRSQMKEQLEHRAAIIQSEVMKHPQFAAALNKKLTEVQQDKALLQDRKEYERLIIAFEKAMDECEAELYSHEDQSWWLCSPNISIADISFSILLHRLWQLGFERRMWDRNRPYIKRYFARIQQLESYRKAISMTDGGGMKFVSNPVFWGVLGAVAIAGGGFYLWNKSQGEGKVVMALVESSDMDPLVLISKKDVGVGITRTIVNGNNLGANIMDSIDPYMTSL